VRLFRKELGRTPHAYRREQQIAQAKLLVGHSTKSMKAIAYELGFCDQYHFARVFKATVGVQPGQAMARCVVFSHAGYATRLAASSIPAERCF
jgi:AraC-like DNA-binding protein